MEAKFQIGDILKTNSLCKREGKKLFGEDFQFKNFRSKVTSIFINKDNMKDGQGDLIPNIYVFENGESLCEKFLEKVK